MNHQKNLDDFILEKINNFKNEDISIIGVDGPTAAGKTILANRIASKLKKNVFIFRLDWTLKSRTYRETKLKKYIHENNSFLYEAEEHMDLSIASNFLNKVKNHNFKKTNLKLKLTKLYNRENGSKNNLNISVNIKKGSVIIIEGHYTGISSICNHLDFNILLIGNKQELLRRKINRVKNYRQSDKTIKYFNLIDLPSFANYLSKYGYNYNLVVDNSDYKKPKKSNLSSVDTWINKNINKQKFKIENLETSKLYDKINLSEEIKTNLIDKNEFYLIIDTFFSLDTMMGDNLITSINNIKKDINQEINAQLIILRNKIRNKQIDFLYTNNFHNLYHRKFPINIGFKLKYNSFEVNILIVINEKNLEFYFHWYGGVEKIEFKRIISEKNINKYKICNVSHHNILKSKLKHSKHIRAFIPTDMTFIDFINKKYPIKKILTSSEELNISSPQIKELFYEQNIFWIQRFSKFSERDFFRDLLDNMGAKIFTINNYLFAFKCSNFNTNKSFDDFFKSWKLDRLRLKSINKGNLQYDEIIDKDRKILRSEVNKTKSFVCLDGQIYYAPNTKKNKNIRQLQKDLFFLLSHKKRIVRKSICNFISLNYTDCYFETTKLWPNEQVISKKISLSEFTNISPTILSDLYLWLNLKNSGNAILAANVYDIRKNGIDIAAYLEASQEEGKPIVIQSSFNAIGQKEKYKNKVSEGYLKLKKGPEEFVNNIYKNARDLYLKNTNKDFLYGIGLDHIDFRYDLPKGRVFRFLNKFKKTNLVTHFTLDSSYLLENPNIRNFNKQKNKLNKDVIKNEFNLLKKIENNHIYDFEFCANELNYVENKKKIYVPNQKDIEFFSNEFFKIIEKSNIKYVNSRPKLIIGNLGTVHHGYDSNNYVRSDISGEWIKSIKKLNFISAVLHGTSRSHPDVLRRATAGCFKINVAGDFLQVFVSNLPLKLKNAVTDKNDNEKKKLFLIRNSLNKLSKSDYKKIFLALNYKCKDLMNLINTPKLTNNDKSYFKYKSFNINKHQAKYIGNLVSHEVYKFKMKKQKKTKNGLFLMSPIEIEYGDFFKKIARLFIKKKLSIFHLDVGDGDFISRKLDVTEKLKYIKKINRKNEIHLHLMVNNPHKNLFSNLDYITHYANLGADYIGLHRRTFSNSEGFENAIKKIISLKKKPGIFLEINEDFDYEISSLVIKYKINWIVFMGVPLGYGGQLFNKTIIPKIKKTKLFFSKKNIDCKFEVDGGLTIDVVDELKNLNIDYYAGWSIVKGNTVKEVSAKIDILRKILN